MRGCSVLDFLGVDLTATFVCRCRLLDAVLAESLAPAESELEAVA